MLRFTVGAAARMSGLLNDLLLLIGSGPTEALRPVNLEEVVAQAIRDLSGELSETHAAITFGPLPLVQGDAIPLARLFRNLIGNSLKFRGADPPEVHISATQRGREWTIHVMDNGIGIAPEYHDSIFGIFMQMDRQPVSGAGVGLASCRKIVEALGGRIWVESEPGTGATFCFTIAAAGMGANSPLGGNGTGFVPKSASG
jgi:light-regulated signal transduction histidine kinase (bacteriophytochrome)